MSKSRLEAFSDGVLAIIITIMVLELKQPHDTSWEAIKPLIPVFVSYAISYTIIGIYWGNHHHLLHTVTKVGSGILWANLHLLFWLSLIPFATAWMGESNFDTTHVVAYACLQCLCGIAYFILLRTIQATNPNNKTLTYALQRQSRKGMLSILVYFIIIPVSFWNTAVSVCLFVLVWIIWWIPDKNIEKALKD
ncbi:MAG: DUF1211 domain-containing protein [Chitinophagaceae bacterium]|nr:DUF1211 domain-containing protein [Chitinophagaceae bacterium]